MGRCKDKVLWVRQHGLFLLCRTSPKEDDNGAVLFVDGPNDGIGELLPAHVLVGVGLMGSDGEYGIEEKNPLVGPGLEVAVVWNAATHIVAEFFVDILQRWRNLLSFVHRERQAMGLVVTVIGILHFM